MNEMPDIDPVDDDIEFVRQHRKNIISNLTSQGIPKDNETVGLLLSALNDMDRTSVARKKIKVESSIVAVNKQATDVIAQIFNMPGSKTLTITDRVTPLNTNEGVLPTVELIDGEMDVGASTLDYVSFHKRVQSK